MELNLAGRPVIVTGGASNIGRGISLAFAREGAHVYVADRDHAQAERLVAEAEGMVVSLPTDVTDFESTRRMAATVLEREGRIDVLVNGAGWTVDRLFVEKPREEWQREVDVELWGVINATRSVLDTMIEKGYGRIVTIGSDAGRIGEWREAVHSAAKAGAIALSKAIAREVGKHGITLNVVCPGFTPGTSEASGAESVWAGAQGEQFSPELLAKIARTYPLRRLATPEDIAPAVLFLASDAASYITGQTLSVSGGYTMV